MIVSLNDLASDELDVRSLMGEKCALAGAFGLPQAAEYVIHGMAMMEHRGEKGCGICSSNGGNFHHLRKTGPVSARFIGIEVGREFPGEIAIGHSRYATSGNPDSRQNVQPFIMETKFGPLAIAHNGNLANHEIIRSKLLRSGSVFQSTTDTEVIVHLIARSKAKSLEKAILEALREVKTAFSLLILTHNQIFAIRDPFGVRPLSLARLGNGFLVYSENYAFNQYPEAEFVREVDKGEMLVFTSGQPGFRSIHYAKRPELFCVFEMIYFLHPRTRHHGCFAEDFRQQLGMRLIEENPDIEGDFIMPLLDSGKQFSIGMEKASKIPYKEYMMRIHNPLRSQRRSFTCATFEERQRAARQKQDLRADRIAGRSAIVGDDSIVRAITMLINCQRLRNAGAKRITVAISAPIITNICPLGMDFQTTQQLAAYHRTIPEIRDFIGADDLRYLSLEGLKAVSNRCFGGGICTGCFGDRYPVKF